MTDRIALDYSQYIWAGANQGDAGSDISCDAAIVNKDLLFSKRGHCPFCKNDAHVVHTTGNRDAVPSLEDGWNSEKTSTLYAQAWACACGWWEVERIEKGTNDIWQSTDIDVIHASLQRFDISSSEAPIAALLDYVVKNHASVCHISPYRMELLVKSVFEDYYNCEVLHCGKSHDGGVDLILIDSESPIAVQIKRRENPSRKEAVKTVREFLGAYLLAEYNRGIIVTTANDFSRDSRRAAEKAITLDLIDSFELVNGEELLRRLDLVAKRPIEYWRAYVTKPDWQWGI